MLFGIMIVALFALFVYAVYRHSPARAWPVLFVTLFFAAAGPVWAQVPVVVAPPPATGLAALVAALAPYTQVLLPLVVVAIVGWLAKKLGIQSQSAAIQALDSVALQGAQSAHNMLMQRLGTDLSKKVTLPSAVDHALGVVADVAPNLAKAAGYSPNQVAALVQAKLAAVNPDLVTTPKAA